MVCTYSQYSGVSWKLQALFSLKRTENHRDTQKVPSIPKDSAENPSPGRAASGGEEGCGEAPAGLSRRGQPQSRLPAPRIWSGKTASYLRRRLTSPRQNRSPASAGSVLRGGATEHSRRKIRLRKQSVFLSRAEFAPTTPHPPRTPKRSGGVPRRAHDIFAASLKVS